MHTNMHTHMNLHAHAQTCIHVNRHPCVHVCANTCARTCARMHIHMLTHEHIYVLARTQRRAHAHRHACTHTRMCTHMHTHRHAHMLWIKSGPCGPCRVCCLDAGDSAFWAVPPGLQVVRKLLPSPWVWLLPEQVVRAGAGPPGRLCSLPRGGHPGGVPLMPHGVGTQAGSPSHPTEYTLRQCVR